MSVLQFRDKDKDKEQTAFEEDIGRVKQAARRQLTGKIIDPAISAARTGAEAVRNVAEGYGILGKTAVDYFTLPRRKDIPAVPIKKEVAELPITKTLETPQEGVIPVSPTVPTGTSIKPQTALDFEKYPTRTVVGSDLPDYIGIARAKREAEADARPLSGLSQFDEMLRTGVLERVPKYSELDIPSMNRSNWFGSLVNHISWVGRIKNIQERNQQVLDFLKRGTEEREAISRMDAEKSQAEAWRAEAEEKRIKRPYDIAESQAKIKKYEAEAGVLGKTNPVEIAKTKLEADELKRISDTKLEIMMKVEERDLLPQDKELEWVTKWKLANLGVVGYNPKTGKKVFYFKDGTHYPLEHMTTPMEKK